MLRRCRLWHEGQIQLNVICVHIATLWNTTVYIITLRRVLVDEHTLSGCPVVNSTKMQCSKVFQGYTVPHLSIKVKECLEMRICY